MARTIVQSTPKYGVQVRTEPRCKICQSPHRAEIEDILYLRSSGQLMESGIRPTTEWITQNAEALWGFKLNSNNLGTHFKGHFRPGTPDAQALAQRDTRTAVGQQIADTGIERVSPEQFLESVIGIGMMTVRNDPTRVTVDHALKAVAELTKRKHDETTAKLMLALAGATGDAIGATAAAIERIPTPDGASPSDEVVEAEVVEDEPER